MPWLARSSTGGRTRWPAASLRIPNRANPTGWRGTAPGSVAWHRRSGRRSWAASGLERPDANGGRPVPSPRPFDRSIGRTRPADPSSSGWAQSTSGCSQRRPWRARSSSLRNGDAGSNRVEGRAVVVQQARHDHLGTARATTDCVARFEHGHVKPGARADGRRRRARSARCRPRSPRSPRLTDRLTGAWSCSTGRSRVRRHRARHSRALSR